MTLNDPPVAPDRRSRVCLGEGAERGQMCEMRETCRGCSSGVREAATCVENAWVLVACAHVLVHLRRTVPVSLLPIHGHGHRYLAALHVIIIRPTPMMFGTPPKNGVAIQRHSAAARHAPTYIL